MAELYNRKREQYLNTRYDEINNMNAERKYKYAWNLIDQITGRNFKCQGIIPAESPSNRLSIWKNHFQNVLAPEIDNK